MPASGTIIRIGQFEVPDKYEVALRAGLRFFVVRYPKRIITAQTIFGFFDVTVHELIGGGTNSNFREDWQTGSNASILFHPQGNSGIGLSFVVDDRFYHNRYVLAEQPIFAIDSMATPDLGIVPGGEANMEIQCFREILYEKRPIYKVVDPTGREREFFWTVEDAEEFRKQIVTVPRGPSRIPHDEQPYLKCKIVEGEKEAKRKEIEDMINRNKGYTNGWTNSPEFRSTIMPKVMALIKTRKQAVMSDRDTINQPGGLKAAVHNLLKEMSPDERRALLFGTPENESTTQGQPEPAEAPDLPTRQRLTKTDLSRKQLQELQILAQERGLDIDGKKRTDLIPAILAYDEKRYGGAATAAETAASATAAPVETFS